MKRYLRYVFYFVPLLMFILSLINFQNCSEKYIVLGKSTSSDQSRIKVSEDIVLSVIKSETTPSHPRAMEVPLKATQPSPEKFPKKSSNAKLNIDKESTKKIKKCKPVKNVIFVKTHKTGSSTIINILQRYSDHHNLSVALPIKGIFLGWPHQFNESTIYKHKEGLKYNFICNHARFSKERMLNLMSDKKNTKIVTIIREPLKQLESGAVYFNYASLFRLPHSDDFVDEFFKDIRKRIHYMKVEKDGMYSLVKNPNAFDLGYSIWDEDPRNISMILERVNRDFNLVMIAERMVESLVLLKEELCWDLEDVAFFTMNKRSNKHHQKFKNVQKARQDVQNWSKIDRALYSYFSRILHQRILEGGSAFQEDLKQLTKINQDLKSKCVEDGLHYEKNQPIDIIELKLNKKVNGTKDQELCENMIRTEILYTEHLMKKLK